MTSQVKRIKLKLLGDRDFRELKIQLGEDDLTTFVRCATSDLLGKHFLEGAVIFVNGKVATENIILEDGDRVFILPSINGG